MAGLHTSPRKQQQRATADTDTNVTENAPSTADTAVIAVVALAVSATAAIVVSKKRREF